MFDPEFDPSELENLKRLFQVRFSRQAEIVVAAPGRVNVIGEHVDYNDGFVLPMAVDRYVTLAGARANDGRVAHFYSHDLEQQIEIRLDRELLPDPHAESGEHGWKEYLRGVLAGFQKLGAQIPAFHVTLQSTVPIGGGLSSSAALAVALAMFLQTLTDTNLEPTQLALLCQNAEHHFAQVPCGIMDQFSSVFAKRDELMLIDCQSQEIKTVPFNDPAVSLLIINSSMRHVHASGQYAQRRSSCDSALAKLKKSSWRQVSLDDLDSFADSLTPIEYRRATHVVTEIARTLTASKMFASGRWSDVGQLMYASHESLRENFEVSTVELDLLVDLSRKFADRGVFGARMTGGGFGGCVVVLLQTERVEAFSNFVAAEYESRTGIRPALFASRPARGAHVVFKADRPS